MMEHPSAYMQERMGERQEDTGSKSFEKKLPPFGADPLKWRRCREDVRALVRCPWGGRQARVFFCLSITDLVLCRWWHALEQSSLLGTPIWLPTCSPMASARQPACRLVEFGRINSIFLIQSYAWPAVTALRSVVMIGSGGQGKTVMGFLTITHCNLSSPSGWVAVTIALPAM